VLFLADIDTIELSFNASTQNILKVVLGLIIFGVALDMKWDDFNAVWKKPRAMLVGLATQLLLFPFLTYLMILAAENMGHPFHPSIALGMLLVAACPGGNMSNFFTHVAKGNTALSVTMSAISTLAAAITTPFNFTFWGSRLASTADKMQALELSFMDMFIDVTIMLAIPMAIGLWISYKFPAFAKKMHNPMRYLSIIFFFTLIILAFVANFNNFLVYVGPIAVIVALQNGIALGSGYGIATLFGASNRDRKTITIEVGIQNSGLGLILCFQYFSSLGGMALIAAWWGVWHIVSGLSLALYWGRK
jgi:BASS family bile acid:Na+ symporter